MLILFQKHKNAIILKLLHSFLNHIRTITVKYFRLCNQSSIKIKTSFLAKLFQKTQNQEKASKLYLHILNYFIFIIFFYNDLYWCNCINMCIYFLIFELYKNQIIKTLKYTDFNDFMSCDWNWESIRKDDNFFFTK